MTSPLPSGDRLKAAFTGPRFQEPSSPTERSRTLSTDSDRSAFSSRPQLGEHGDIAAFDVQNAESPHSNKKFPFFMRGGQRYHISTMVAGAEIYHTFTLYQWEKIADKMDALKEHSDLASASILTEFSVNLSTESCTGIDQNNQENYRYITFSPNLPTYDTFKDLHSYVQELLPAPIVSMNFRDAYASEGSERAAFSTVTKKSKAKTNERDSKAFKEEHMAETMTRIQQVRSYPINDESSEEYVNALTYQHEKQLADLEETFTVNDPDTGETISLEADLKKQLEKTQKDLASIRENQPGDTQGIRALETSAKELAVKIEACGHKEQLRLAAILYNSGNIDPIIDSLDTAHYTQRNPEHTQAILQNAFDARLVLCHKEGLVDDQGKILTSMTAQQRAKYEEITDTAALLIPDLDPAQAGDRSESDHMLQIFYGGGSTLNAFTHRPTSCIDGDDRATFPSFPNVIPPEGRSAKVHTAMRNMVQKAIA